MKKRKKTGDKPIILVGMMGCGKTSVGKALAKALDRDFYDSDERIEEIAGMPVGEIFKTHGEAAFRKHESEVFKILLRSGNSVIAAGGGAFQSFNTRTLIKEAATSVWLSGKARRFYKRVKNSDRPLIGTKKDFKALYKARKSSYSKADFKIRSDKTTVQETTEDIIRLLRL